MSSSIHESEARPDFYVLQSGIAFWEAPSPVADWGAKTLSVCSRSSEHLREIAVGLLEACERSWSWLRLHVSSAAAPSRVQRRRLEKTLARDPPGFTGTALYSTEAQIVAICSLERPESVNLEYLNSYRDTMLIGVSRAGIEPDKLRTVVSKLGPVLKPETVRHLLDAIQHAVVCRFLDMETHVVAQMIGGAQEAAILSGCLDSAHVAQLLDTRDISSRINAWGEPV